MLGLDKNELKISETFSESSEVTLYTGDSLDFLKSVPDNSFKLILSSPPYNVGKEYEVREELAIYLEEQKKMIQELVRVLKDDGSICWQVGNYVKNGEVFPLDIYYYDLFKECGLKMRNRIIWHFGHGLHAKLRFSGRYETISWFTKTDDYTFNLDPVRVPQKYPGKRHYKGDKKGQLSGNPLGKNPTDIWEIITLDWDRQIWNIPNVKSNHPEKTEHPCQFPVELVERCILALTNEGDIVYDPYSGVGSTLLASLKNNRKAVGSDREKKYNNITRERIKAYINGTLKFRPIQRGVYQPPNEKSSNNQEDRRKNEDLRQVLSQ